MKTIEEYRTKSQAQQLIVHYGDQMQELTDRLSHLQTTKRIANDNISLYKYSFPTLAEKQVERVAMLFRREALLSYAIEILCAQILQLTKKPLE